jgi:type I restriction enzyme S subunit
VWARLFRLCEPDAPIVYGILQPGPDVRPNGVPYVRPTEIKDGQIRLSEIRHTSPEIAAQYTRATIRKGDVLLTIVGTLGATAVVPEELDGGNITQSSCRLRPDARFIDTSYLVIYLRARTLLNQYRGFSLGSAVQRLNIAHVRALAIPLPPSPN